MTPQLVGQRIHERGPPLAGRSGPSASPRTQAAIAPSLQRTRLSDSARCPTPFINPGAARVRQLPRSSLRIRIASSMRGEKNFAVADFSGLRRGEDRLHDVIDDLVAQHNLQFDFGQKVNAILTATIELRVAFLASMAAHFQYRKSVDANCQEALLSRHQAWTVE